MARYAIFLEEVKYFLKDNEKDLVWLLRAAHHHPDHAKFNGQEELPEDDGALAQLVTHVRALENDPETFQPKPETGPDFFPLVHLEDEFREVFEYDTIQRDKSDFSTVLCPDFESSQVCGHSCG